MAVKEVIKLSKHKEKRKEFMQSLLDDLEGLKYMLENGMFEKNNTRIGVEQEVDLVDNRFNPSPIAMEILKNLNPDFFTNEYALFNLEINSAPHLLKDLCFSQLQNELEGRLQELEKEAKKHEALVLLTGILPTLRESHLTEDMLTPLPRYQKLIETVNQQRGKNYEFHIKSIDELITRNNPGVFGGSFTSFQVHLQVNPDEVVDMYNWSQIILGPILALSANSPLFLGKRLWQETRVALFQQTTDTRKPYSNPKNEKARVSMGSDWVYGSVLEVFQNNLAQYPVLLGTSIKEVATAMLEKGKTPKLEALQFYNGTIYPWNRMCYGITNNKPHLRIENRIFPAGPTMHDQIANAVFWIGLMQGMPDEARNIQEKMSFSTAIDNFQKAARYGLEVEFNWYDGKQYSAKDLILNELLPLAYSGLKKSNINPNEANYYLRIIKKRVESKKTGARWILNNYDQLLKNYTEDEALKAITAGLYQRQVNGDPVHTWSDTSFDEANLRVNEDASVEKIMTTNLITINENDPLKLASNIFVWKQINHLPVENDEGALVGLLSKRKLFDLLLEKNFEFETLSIKDVMQNDFVKLKSDANINDAIKIMLNSRITCLPVVKGSTLIGLVTQFDFVKFSSKLIEKLHDNTKREKGDETKT